MLHYCKTLWWALFALTLATTRAIDASLVTTTTTTTTRANDDPFPNTVLKEVQFKGGLVGASSNYDNGTTFHPNNAFQRTSNAYWHSGQDAEAKGGLFVPFPHLIWYSFEAPFTPGRVSFRPRSDTHCGANGYWCGATKWQFIGTNDEDCDENSAWTILCEDMSGKHFERSMQSKYCTVNESIKKQFKCLGISVLDSSFAGGYACVSMNGIRMWERVLQ